MGNLICEQHFWNVWIRNESVQAEIGQILHTDTHPHTTAAKLVVRIVCCRQLFDKAERTRKTFALTSVSKCWYIFFGSFDLPKQLARV